MILRSSSNAGGAGSYLVFFGALARLAREPVFVVSLMIRLHRWRSRIHFDPYSIGVEAGVGIVSGFDPPRERGRSWSVCRMSDPID